MSTKTNRTKVSCLLIGKTYKPGDPPPSEYLGWHVWAAVQHKAGLRQVRCPGCSRFRFPQEMSEKTIESRYFTISRRGREDHVDRLRICLDCARERAARVLANQESDAAHGK